MPAGGTRLRTQTQMRRLPKSQNQSGVAYVELLVVIAIIAVVATLALMQWGRSREQFRRQNVARNLKVAFERARFDSVKRRADDTTIYAKVVLLGTSDSATSYKLVTDTNMDSVLTTADEVSTSFGDQQINIYALPGVAMDFPVTVAFNMRGEVIATGAGGGAILPSFLVCNGDCRSGPNSSNSNIVIVTPTGTVNLLAGGGGPPSFDDPSQSGVAEGDLINTVVTLLGIPTPTPIPSPTPPPDPGGTPNPSPSPTGSTSPSPSPTGSASPSPSPTGSASPSPTQSGTPVVCTVSANDQSFTRNADTGVFRATYSGANGDVLTISPGGSVTSVAPTSFTTTGSTGFVDITVHFPNGNPSGTVTISGCGSSKTVNISVN